MFLLLMLTGYGFSYDGCVDDKYYFQINTPKTDYGIVVSADEVYCDTIYNR